MESFDPDKIELFLLFAVPGMIALYVRSQFLDGKMPNLGDGIAAYIALSLVYHAIWFTIFPSLYAMKLATASTSDKLESIALLFVGPALLGLLAGLNARKQWLRRLFNKVGLNTIHPVASAWDWKFSYMSESWVLIVLKDGTQWGGDTGAQVVHFIITCGTRHFH